MKKKNRFLKFVLFVLTCIGVMYLVNVIIARLAARHSYLKADDGAFFDWNGKQIFYKTSGTGKPLVLLHDLTPAGSALEWSRVEKTFSQSHTVYCVELPGCARSSRGSDDYVGYYYIQFLRAFISQVVGEKADIAATGTSALAALSAVVYDTELADRLVLVNPGGYANYSFRGKLSGILAFILRLPILGTFVYNMMHSKAALGRFYIDRLFFNPYRVDEELVGGCYEAAHLSKSSGKHLLSSFLNGDMAIDAILALKKLEIPTLLIVGKSMPNRSALLKTYQEASPMVKAEVIADSRQYPQLEEPLTFAETVEDFLL